MQNDEHTTPGSVPNQGNGAYAPPNGSLNTQAQQPTGQQDATQQGNPSQQDGSPQVVYMSRPMLPQEPEIPEEAKRLHEESKRKYPELHISDGEFVISAVRRHPIGLISIWGVSALIIVLIAGCMAFLVQNQNLFTASVGIQQNAFNANLILATFFLLVTALIIVGGLVSTYVYLQNKFFLTNESVMQFIQMSLFSRKEQTISLANIEDASYRQHGIVQHLFNYGNIRLSTQGEETTYRFSYVSNPRHQIALLNDAVEAFKNGRPISSKME